MQEDNSWGLEADDNDNECISGSEEGEAETMPNVPEALDSDGFLSAASRKLLEEACAAAGIDDDSPDINSSNLDLRRVLLMPQSVGGIGLSEQVRYKPGVRHWGLISRTHSAVALGF